MALLLTEQDIQSLMDMPALIDTLELAQIEYSRGSAIQPLRSRVQISKYPGALDLMPGYLPEGNALGVKVLTLRTDNPTLGLPAIHATVLLINPRDGRLLAIMAGGAVTAFRTAAVSGVATRHLAREDSHSLAIIGTGRQARTHLWAMAQRSAYQTGNRL